MGAHDQLLAERSAHQPAEAITIPSTIRTILFHVHQDSGLENRLQVALSVARACGAHLHLLHVTPIEAYTVVDAFGTFVSGDIVRALQVEADALRTRLEAWLGNEDVSWDYEEITGELLPHLLKCAALSDLVIVGRGNVNPEFPGLGKAFLGDVLQQLRTPLLLIGDDCDRFDPFGAALIAWNGSYEVADAVRGALGFLKLASNVRVVTIEEEKPGVFPSTRLLEYLSRHGIHAELSVQPPGPDTVADQLTDYAVSAGSAYMVMGGYSHSRAGEYLFGGVTRDLLSACPFSILIGR